MKNFLEQLKQAESRYERELLAADPECPLEVLKIMIEHDVEESVVKIATTNKNCGPDLIKFGESRLSQLQKAEKSTICPIPWKHLEVQQNGDLRICCMAIYDSLGKLEKEGNTTANIRDTTLDEARNLPLIKELRRSMINGEKHQMCKQCWDHESLGLSSKRIHMTKIYGDKFTIKDDDGSIDVGEYPLSYLDLRFGNLCNLACRSCGPSDSSLWIDDYHKMRGQEESVMSFYGKKHYKIRTVNNKAQIVTDPEDFLWYEQENFWTQIEEHAANIDRLYFTGGEPSINKTHFKLLEFLINKQLSKNIILEYNSNMVAIPDKLYGWWNQFKDVGIGCSIDGINEYANYIRPPSQWDTLEKNLDQLGYNNSPTIRGSIATTISVYNILHFLDLTKWLLSKKYNKIDSIPSFHMLEGPPYLNVQVLPLEFKKYVIEEYNKFYIDIEETYGKRVSNVIKLRYTGIINHMMAVDLSRHLPRLKSATLQVDEIKEQNLDVIIPWLAEILKNY